MTGPGALAVTGTILAVAAVVVALAHDARGITWEERETYTRAGWALFAAACACFVGAAWWAAT